MYVCICFIVRTQESASSCSDETVKLSLSTRYEKLNAVSQLLTPAAERLLKAVETRNLEEFV